MIRFSVRTLVFAVACALGTVVGCSSSTDEPAAETAGQKITVHVGTEGGVVALPSGAGVTIPAGALAVPTDITVESLAVPPASDLASLGGTPVSAIYAMSPEGLTFLKPVTVTIPVAGAPTGTLSVYTAPHATKSFTLLATTVAASLASAQTTHFSDFGAMQITGDAGTPASEAGPDAAAQLDAPADTSVASDAPAETSVGADVVVQPDVTVEAAADAPVEAAREAAVDAPVEAAIDAPIEAAVEAAVDAPAEAAPDAPTTQTIVSLTPSEALEGSGDLPVTIVLDPPGCPVYGKASISGSGFGLVAQGNNCIVTIPAAKLSNATDAGTLSVAVSGASGYTPAVTFLVKAAGAGLNPLPVIANTDPPNVPVSSAGQGLYVNGTSFVAGSVVLVNGVALPTTEPTATQRVVDLLAWEHLSATGNLKIQVVNPAPGGGASAVTLFAVTGTNPTPDLASATPSQIAVGAPATDVVVHTSGAFSYGAQITALPTGALYPSYLSCTFVAPNYTDCHVTMPATLLAADTNIVLTAHNGAVVGSTVTVTVGAPSDGGTDASGD